MVVEIRDWCQNVGEYNTYNFCIWHFGLCVIVSKIDRCRSSDPPYEIAINPWWRGGRGLPSLIALFSYGGDRSVMTADCYATDNLNNHHFNCVLCINLDIFFVLLHSGHCCIST